MENALLHYVFLPLKAILWSWILFQGRKWGLFRQYPLVFVYVAASAFFQTSLLLIVTLIGSANYFYATWYVIAELGCLALGTAILLSIYLLFDSFRIRRDWHFLLVPAVLAAAEFSSDHSVWFYFRLINIGYAIQSYVGICALARRVFSRTVSPGWNLAMVLLAFSLPGALHASIFAGRLAGAPAIPEIYWKLTALSSWIILAVGMSEHAPPHRVAVRPPAIRESLVRMRHSIRLLWALLRH